MTGLSDWEGPDNGPWVRRGEGGIPHASVVLSGTEAFATVTHKGKAHRQKFPEMEQARRWCDEVLADTRVPRSKRTKPVVPATPAAPARSTLERLVAVLKKDVVLAWQLAKAVRVVGPWEKVGGDWYQRADASGFNVATVRFDLHPNMQWMCSEFEPGDSAHEVWVQSGFPTAEDALAACDAHLTGEGWLLVPP